MQSDAPQNLERQTSTTSTTSGTAKKLIFFIPKDNHFQKVSAQSQQNQNIPEKEDIKQTPLETTITTTSGVEELIEDSSVNLLQSTAPTVTSTPEGLTRRTTQSTL